MVQDFKKKEIDFAADMKTITYLLKDDALGAAVLERFAIKGSAKCNVLTVLAGVVAVSALDVTPPHESALAKANVIFDAFDLDNDGRVSEVELVRPQQASSLSRCLAAPFI